MAHITGADTAWEARSRGDGLGRRVENAEATVFQGRRAELNAVLARLGTRDRLPGVVSLTGPPGIGKTAFVYALGRACRDCDAADVAIIDSRDFPHTLPGLLDAVRPVSAGDIRDRVSGRPARPLLLVFDTFEEMRDLEEQFWERFLPGLRGPVLVLVSGRSSPSVGARSSGWRLVLDEVALTALPDDQARRLLAHLGVTSEDAASAIVDLAGGSPLLLCVAAEVHRSGAVTGQPDLGVPGEIARSLIARMSRELRRSDVRELLQAASLVRTFDEELLTAMAGRVTAETFRGVPGDAHRHEQNRNRHPGIHPHRDQNPGAEEDPSSEGRSRRRVDSHHRGYRIPSTRPHRVRVTAARLSFTSNPNGTATIAGTPHPSSGARYSIIVTATNASGTASQPCALIIGQPPAITSASTASAIIGSAFSFQVTTTGFPAPKITKSGRLPKGITFRSATAAFSGTAKTGTSGTHQVTITAKNPSETVTQNFTLNIPDHLPSQAGPYATPGTG